MCSRFDTSSTAGGRPSASLFEALNAAPIVDAEIKARARADLMAGMKGCLLEPKLPHPTCSHREVPFNVGISVAAWRHFEQEIDPGKIQDDNIALFHGPQGNAILHLEGVEMLTCILETPEAGDEENERLVEAADDSRNQAVGVSLKMLEDWRLKHLGATVLRLIGAGLAPAISFLRTDRGYGKIRGHFLIGDVLFTRTDAPIWELLDVCRQHGATTLCAVQRLSEGPEPQPDRDRSEDLEMQFGSKTRSIEIGRPGAARLSFFSLRNASDPYRLLDELIDTLSAKGRQSQQEAMDRCMEIIGNVAKGALEGHKA